jgi:hypothetical protein
MPSACIRECPKPDTFPAALLRTIYVRSKQLENSKVVTACSHSLVSYRRWELLTSQLVHSEWGRLISTLPGYYRCSAWTLMTPCRPALATTTKPIGWKEHLLESPSTSLRPPLPLLFLALVLYPTCCAAGRCFIPSTLSESNLGNLHFCKTSTHPSLPRSLVLPDQTASTDLIST